MQRGSGSQCPIAPGVISGMTRLRNYFLTGFIVAAPLAITVYIAWSFVGWINSWVKPYVPARYSPDTYLPFAVPGFGLLVALFLITLIGFLTANIVGRSIVPFRRAPARPHAAGARRLSRPEADFRDRAVQQERHVPAPSGWSNTRARASGRWSSSPPKGKPRSTPGWTRTATRWSRCSCRARPIRRPAS